MKYYRSEVMKNQVGKIKLMLIYLLHLVTASRYFLEQLLKQKIKKPQSDCRF